MLRTSRYVYFFLPMTLGTVTIQHNKNEYIYIQIGIIIKIKENRKKWGQAVRYAWARNGLQQVQMHPINCLCDELLCLVSHALMNLSRSYFKNIIYYVFYCLLGSIDGYTGVFEKRHMWSRW